MRIYDNGKPLHADNYLKFATKGVKQGDIAFTSGNPGATEREDTLAQLEFQRDAAQPFILNLFSELRGVLTEFATKGAGASAHVEDAALLDREFAESLQGPAAGPGAGLADCRQGARRSRFPQAGGSRSETGRKLMAAPGTRWRRRWRTTADIYRAQLAAGAVAAAAVRPAGSRHRL